MRRSTYDVSWRTYHHGICQGTTSTHPIAEKVSTGAFRRAEKYHLRPVAPISLQNYVAIPQKCTEYTQPRIHHLTSDSILTSDTYTSMRARKMGMPALQSSLDRWRSEHHISRLDAIACVYAHGRNTGDNVP